MSLVVTNSRQNVPCRKDYLQFLAAWLRAPLRTGAVAPSSPALARQMAFAAAVRPGMRVVELGPGTGVVTEALLAAGVIERDLVLVEADERFCDLLQQRYPNATILCDDAFDAVEGLLEVGAGIGAVVSSLPLFVYSRTMRGTLCANALRLVGPHGRMVQFTYSHLSPVPRSQGARATGSRRIWGNVPPAVVWTYQEAVPRAG